MMGRREIADNIFDVSSEYFRFSHQELVEELFNKLVKYENLKEDGLVPEHPCEVGDIIYIIDIFFNVDRNKCAMGCDHYNKGSDILTSCSFSELFGQENSDCFCISEITATKEWILKNLDLFGKTVFTDKEKANSVLTLMKSVTNRK